MDDVDLGEILDGTPEPAAIARLAKSLAGSARDAGGRAVASGRWLAPTLIDTAPRIPVRDIAALQEQHGGLAGQSLADELVRNASRASAAIGAASGALMSVEQFAP